MKKRFAPAAAVFLVCLFLAGCGYKTPPLPPLKKTAALPAPADFTYELKDNIAVLNWKAEGEPQYFEVFRAVKTEADCEGCPFVFKKAGTVNMPDTAFRIRIEPDVKSYFRVQAVGKSEVRSAYTKTVLIEVE